MHSKFTFELNPNSLLIYVSPEPTILVLVRLLPWSSASDLFFVKIIFLLFPCTAIAKGYE